MWPSHWTNASQSSNGGQGAFLLRGQYTRFNGAVLFVAENAVRAIALGTIYLCINGAHSQAAAHHDQPETMRAVGG